MTQRSSPYSTRSDMQTAAVHVLAQQRLQYYMHNYASVKAKWPCNKLRQVDAQQRQMFRMACSPSRKSQVCNSSMTSPLNNISKAAHHSPVMLCHASCKRTGSKLFNSNVSSSRHHSFRPRLLALYSISPQHHAPSAGGPRAGTPHAGKSPRCISCSGGGRVRAGPSVRYSV